MVRALARRVMLAVALCAGAASCGAKTGLLVPDRTDDASRGGADDATADAPQGLCAPSTVEADVFGAVRYFAGGVALASGRYRVRYVDGCMKYSPGQGWAVHAYAPDAGGDQFWLVGADAADRLRVPPGTIGFLVGAGGFVDYDACVAANRALPAAEFDFRGGRLGVWLRDAPYSDNAAPSGGRHSPTWEIECLR